MASHLVIATKDVVTAPPIPNNSTGSYRFRSRIIGYKTASKTLPAKHVHAILSFLEVEPNCPSLARESLAYQRQKSCGICCSFHRVSIRLRPAYVPAKTWHKSRPCNIRVLQWEHSCVKQLNVEAFENKRL